MNQSPCPAAWEGGMPGLPYTQRPVHLYTAMGGGGGTTLLVSKHTNINETIEIRKTEQNMMKNLTINALYSTKSRGRARN